MTNLAITLLLFNSASAIVVMCREFLRRGGYLTLPFLISLVFLTWYLPQAWTLLKYPGLDMEGLVRLSFMSLLCFWAILLGWYRGLGRWRSSVSLNLPVRHLLVPAYVITLFAIAMRALIEMQPVEVRVADQWTGVITILAFFASVGVISMAISTTLVFKEQTVATVVLFFLNLTIYLPLVFIYFRRAEAFGFGFAILAGLFFVNGRVISRLVLIALAIVGFFFVNAVGDLRALGGAYRMSDTGTIEMNVPSVRELAEIDWSDAVDLNDRIQRSEIMNAVVGMTAVAQTGSYTLGAQFWNRLVGVYVPSRLVGMDFKEGLLLADDALSLAHEVMNFERHNGATHTGFLDVYQDFWFFGCLVWWLSGYVMGRLMYHALRGRFISYTLYIVLMSYTLQITTHFGYYLFVQPLLIVLVITMLRLWLTRKKATSDI